MSYCRDCEYGKKREEDDSAEIPSWINDRTRYCTKYGKTVSDYDCCDEYEDEPSVCYITTAACKIMGLQDNNEYLTTLREFRSNILRKNKKYYKLLILYDVIGPKISKALMNDKDREEITSKIMIALKRACTLIKKNKYEDAVNEYVNMTKTLADYYDIAIEEITDKQVDEIDIEKSGTGRLVYKMK